MLLLNPILQSLPSLPDPHADVPAYTVARFDVSSLPEGTFDTDASGDPGTMQSSDHHGAVKNAIRRTLDDQKELYLTPFKESNFKWDALELVGTGSLIAADRHIEKHIGNGH